MRLRRTPSRRGVAEAGLQDEPLAPSARQELGLIALIGAWLLVGLFGHSPWKPDEGHAFGIVYSLLQDGDWVVPRLAGEASVDRPPLYHLVAAALARGFAWLLPLHDGARLASALFVGTALACIAAAGQTLFGRQARWLPVLLLAGCLGLWDRAHYLQPFTATLCGFALAALGLALTERRPIAAGLALGCGIGTGFLATGTFAPIALSATALLLLGFPQWRTRSFSITLAVAALAAVPWLVIWPVALHARSPELLGSWWQGDLWRLLGYGVGPDRDPWYHARNLPWIAWPAWPLALWALHLRWRGFGGGLMTPGIQMPATMAAVTLVLLVLAPDARTVHGLPLLVPLALLGAAEVDTLDRGYSAALDWFGNLFWSVIAIVLWVLWVQSVTTGMAPAIARLLGDATRGFVTPIQPWAVAIGVTLTVLWIVLVRPARHTNRRVLLNWFAGSLLAWGLFSTIWMPYQESRRGYRGVALAVRSELPADAGCLASRGLGETQRASLDYFAGLQTLREEVRADHGCQFLLVQDTARSDPGIAGWTLVWTGARPGDGGERYRLYRRDGIG